MNWTDLLLWTLIGLVVLANTLGVLLVALQLPGTWIILLATGGLAWYAGTGWGSGMISLEVMVALILLAGLGELIEFLAGTAGGLIAGSTKWGAFWAAIGGVLGALVGTVVIPIPLIGTLLGAVLGAGLGSTLSDVIQGRPWNQALHGGGGAAVGRFGGALGKLLVAVLMWGLALMAIVWP